MVAEIFDIITRPFASAMQWFYSLLSASGMTSFVFSCILIALIGSIVILPIRGGRVGGGSLSVIATKTVRDASEPSRRR